MMHQSAETHTSEEFLYTTSTVGSPSTSYDRHEVLRQLKKFKIDHESNPLAGHTDFTFITHAVAIKLLFSPDVKESAVGKMNGETTGCSGVDFTITGNNFSREFFANLLLQRASKIKVEQFAERSNCSPQTAKATNSFPNVTKVLQYPGGIHVKIDCVLDRSFYREKVLNCEHYFTYDQMMMDFESRNDKIDGISKLFQNGELSLDDGSAAYHYLLFGLETLRNPSAFIYHMMLFDLRHAQKITWLDAFQLMPLRACGAVMASRLINCVYSPYMPVEYKYDSKSYEKCQERWFEKDRWNKNNLAVAGNILKGGDLITKKWLLMKFEGKDRYFQYLDQNNEIITERVKKVLFNLLEEAVFHWTTIDLKR